MRLKQDGLFPLQRCQGRVGANVYFYPSLWSFGGSVFITSYCRTLHGQIGPFSANISIYRKAKCD